MDFATDESLGGKGEVVAGEASHVPAVFRCTTFRGIQSCLLMACTGDIQGYGSEKLNERTVSI